MPCYIEKPPRCNRVTACRQARSAAYRYLAVADSFPPRPTPAGFHLDMGLPLTARGTDVRRITILGEYAPTSRVESGVSKRRKARPMTTTEIIRDNLLLKG